MFLEEGFGPPFFLWLGTLAQLFTIKMSFRDELIRLIEAYAVAQASGNDHLKKLMVEELKEWLSVHDIIGPVDVPDEVLETVGKAKK
jgi:hypothetical protein